VEKKEEKKLYEVVILRLDGQHIVAVRTDNYDECYEKWQKLHAEWTETSNENRPFVLMEPVITAFNPTLIKEITLIPVVEQTASKYNNPYQSEMVNKGLTETLNKYKGAGQQGGDLLDNGYQFDGGYK